MTDPMIGVNENSLSDILSKISLDDIPESLFVSNLPETLFTSDEIKTRFEELFLNFKAIKFLYFEKFRRCRIYFESSHDAAKARIAFHLFQFDNCELKLSFPEVNIPSTSESPSLQLPQLERFFLISPPASPPVGWEPIFEERPVVDVQLLSALANLEPGKAHQLHPGTEYTPSVVVHVCETVKTNDFGKTKIPQTRRPDFK